MTQLNYTNPIDALGNTISFDNHDERVIIGVTDDFIVAELAIAPEPLVISVNVENPKYASIRLTPTTDFAEFNTFLEKSWKDLEPFIPVAHNFHAAEIEDYHS